MTDKLDIEIKNIEREIILEETKTNIAKTKFIYSIKNEFGQAMKKNPRKVKIIKTNKCGQIINFFKGLFSKF